MKHILTFLTMAICAACLGQEACPELWTACGEGTTWDEASQTCVATATTAWQPDADGDDLIGVGDLLMLLSVFGDTDLDQDGIFDSGDSCVGFYDECGVCNGEGPTVLVVDSILFTVDSMFNADEGVWVTSVQQDTLFHLVCSEEFLNCGDLVHYQGYGYATTQIGGQCWFAENLRSESYRNGDEIPNDLSPLEWSLTGQGATAVYGQDGVCLEPFSADGCWERLQLYGRLYNGYAVTDPRQLCPQGWHIPTNNDWAILADTLGGAELAGVAMKSIGGWGEEGGGSNASGFSALPGGRMIHSGSYQHLAQSGWWWTNTKLNKMVANNSDQLLTANNGSRAGMSVRCIQDSE